MHNALINADQKTKGHEGINVDLHRPHVLKVRLICHISTMSHAKRA